jgi:hypothetical protein
MAKATNPVSKGNARVVQGVKPGSKPPKVSHTHGYKRGPRDTGMRKGSK